MRIAFATALLLLSAGPAAAQVGYPPAESPFRDVAVGQSVTLLGGYYNAGEDRVGIAPRSGPLVGARYDVRIGGPAWFTVRAAYVASERLVIDPRRSLATRELGVESWPLYLADVGITFALTGAKSWHHLVPTLAAGLGIASDFKSGHDIGDFQFGTPFAFSLGGGVRYVPGGAWSFRADLTDHLYKISYPDLYRRPATDGTTVLDESDEQEQWTHNVGLTIGAAYQLFR